MKTKDKTKKQMNKDKKIILWEINVKLEKIMNEKISKRRREIRELQKLGLPQKVERILLIRLHIFYLILLINLYTKNEN